MKLLAISLGVIFIISITGMLTLINYQLGQQYEETE